MATSSLRLSLAAANPRQLAQRTIKNPAWLDPILEGLDSDVARTKYGCAKALRVISEERPELLYHRFDFFARLLGNPNKILHWEALFVLSHLARVDSEERCDAILDPYLAPIPGPVMITAANAIQGGARIARAKPGLADRIGAAVLGVAQARYQTAECRNVAIGHAIIALGRMFDLLADQESVLEFARKQLKNTRPATRKKAEQFLRKYERGAKDDAA